MTLGREFLSEHPAQTAATDAFEDVLRSMHVESSLYVRLQMRAPFGVHFDTPNQARLVVVTRGSCWLVSKHVRRPTPLAAGDCLLLKAHAEFSLQDELK